MMLLRPRLFSFLQFFGRNNFRKEMTLVIILKLLALCAIWLLFFSHSNHPRPLEKATLLQHFLT
jgi:hypothetical protein